MNKENVIAIFEKIIEGCRNVKEDAELHQHAKDLATLVIRDCNLAIKELKE
jgi:hypothetical protein